MNDNHYHPLVSIITPSFNRKELIAEAAASVLAQKYKNWEWIVVDDGSTDDSFEFVCTLAASDNRVKALKRDRLPKGANTCRNIGITAAKGELVVFLDSDDLLSSCCLQNRVDYFAAQPELDFMVFPVLFFNHKPDDLRVLRSTDSEEDDLKRALRIDPICQTSGALWKKSALEKMGGWNEKLHILQDIELLIRALILQLKYVKHLDVMPDAFTRISGEGISRTDVDSVPKSESRLSILQYCLGHFTETGEKELYQDELRLFWYMSIMPAIRSGHAPVWRSLLEIGMENHFIDSGLKRHFKKYAFLHKYKRTIQAMKVAGAGEKVFWKLHNWIYRNIHAAGTFKERKFQKKIWEGNLCL